MTQREIANLCCRVLALYALIHGLGLLPRALALLWPFVQTRMSNSEAVVVAIGGAAEPLLWIASGLFIWRWSGLIAAWMIGTDLHDRRDEPESRPHFASAATVHAIAFSTVGLWLLVGTTPRLLGYVVELALIRARQGDWKNIDGPSWSASIVTETLCVALGLYLLFGASGLVRILRGAKNFGLEGNEQPELARRGERDAADVSGTETRA